MAALPIAPVVRPADLAGQRNGVLDPALLSVVPGGSRLHHIAARCWGALVVAAKADGIDLTYTPGGCYRDLERQTQLFYARWTTTPVPLRPRTTFAGQTWFLKRGVAQAARPGTSNHGWGLAVDTAGGSSPSSARSLNRRELNWMLANAASCGWSWELQSEPWHIRLVTGDRIPQRVLDIEAFLAAVRP